MGLKNLPSQDRPRERLIRYGCENLSSIELIAILLGSGTKQRSVLELAADLLSHFGSIQSLADASLQEMKSVKGIGLAKSIQLKAAFALLHRCEETQALELLDTPSKVYQFIRKEMELQPVEVLLAVLRDVRRGCIHREIVSKGILTELILHPREVFHVAIRHRAHTLILAHNHPSGNPAPSAKDLEITELLVRAGKLVGIELVDHLVIGRNSYFSFYENGLIPNYGAISSY